MEHHWSSFPPYVTWELHALVDLPSRSNSSDIPMRSHGKQCLSSFTHVLHHKSLHVRCLRSGIPAAKFTQQREHTIVVTSSKFVSLMFIPHPLLPLSCRELDFRHSCKRSKDDRQVVSWWSRVCMNSKSCLWCRIISLTHPFHGTRLACLVVHLIHLN